MAETSCAIAVMAKASQPGRAKTRLAPPLTPEEAASFNTAFLQDVAANLLEAGRQESIGGYMAYGPPGSEPFFRKILPPGIDLVESWFPNFGDCLFGAVQALLARGHISACVLNADSPTLPTAFLVTAARQLARPGDRIVLGPSRDGGYYLLGLKAAHKRLFQDIDWSTERVARQTLERAAELGLETHVLPDWYDVDDAHALRALAGELFGGDRPASGEQPYRASHTAALMRTLFASTDLAARLGVPAPAAAEASSA